MDNKTSLSGELTIAYPSDQPVSNCDPARIETARQANILRNIYSRLISMDDSGNLVSQIANDFRVDDTSVIIQVRENLRTVDGLPITAEDVVFSLKRLMVLKNNTHGELQSFICGGQELRSINDDCPGIKVEGRKIIFQTLSAAKARFLLPLLAGGDFAIIPKGSVDASSPKLEITDYRNTSGPFFLESDKNRGSIRLRANKNHYAYSARIPQAISFKYLLGADAIKAYEAGEIDLISTIDSTSSPDMIKMSSDRDDTSLHRTFDIRLYMMQFTKKGVRDFQVPERLSVGAKIKKAAREFVERSGMSETDEFFPILSSGRLSPDRAAELKKLLQKSVEQKRPNKSVTIGYPSIAGHAYADVIKRAGFIPIAMTTFAMGLPIDEQPDAYLTLTDSAFDENISFVSYNIAIGSFGLDQESGRVWLNDYMDTPDASQRVKKMSELQWYFLSNAYSIPIAMGPYTALVRKPWMFDFPKSFAGTPLWLIHRP